MNIAIIDYESGNISSVINSFKKASTNQNIAIKIEVTSDLKTILSSDKIILPGQGSFKNCTESLEKIKDLKETLNEFDIIKKKPLVGICVGMQMFADVGYEETETKGLGWIAGKVSKIDNKEGKYKLPHIGWNQINIIKKNKILNNKNSIKLNEGSELVLIDYSDGNTGGNFIKNTIEVVSIDKNAVLKNILIQDSKSNGHFYKYIKVTQQERAIKIADSAFFKQN